MSRKAASRHRKDCQSRTELSSWLRILQTIQSGSTKLGFKFIRSSNVSMIHNAIFMKSSPRKNLGKRWTTYLLCPIHIPMTIIYPYIHVHLHVVVYLLPVWPLRRTQRYVSPLANVDSNSNRSGFDFALSFPKRGGQKSPKASECQSMITGCFNSPLAPEKII